MSSRRNFIKQSGILKVAGVLAQGQHSVAHPTEKHINLEEKKLKWEDGSRLVVSVTMHFEAGGEPDNLQSPFPPNMLPRFKDLPGSTWYAYGYKEGIPRMLDNWDKLGIKVTSHMVGSAVLRNPALAKEIVDRGHEAAAHGKGWNTQYNMSNDEEKKFTRDGAEAIKQITGTTNRLVCKFSASWRKYT
ncbi:polysaccharide deacetylase family protein [Pedobacter sandarakinus]|uniref:polysaccharide deacetylase family protein n=1 Tax=Pedobacter sandarakinus TaxID=353156 RepID=UPI002248603F|nr:polysaccharide deacetylase family protein [Pedobacter sandarakinus]MCX2574059.1 polysaccharide deacetylase family protein [Pedobacter sandarakinus]